MDQKAIEKRALHVFVACDYCLITIPSSGMNKLREMITNFNEIRLYMNEK